MVDTIDKYFFTIRIGSEKGKQKTFEIPNDLAAKNPTLHELRMYVSGQQVQGTSKDLTRADKDFIASVETEMKKGWQYLLVDSTKTNGGNKPSVHGDHIRYNPNGIKTQRGLELDVIVVAGKENGANIKYNL